MSLICEPCHELFYEEQLEAEILSVSVWTLRDGPYAGLSFVTSSLSNFLSVGWDLRQFFSFCSPFFLSFQGRLLWG